MDTEDDVTEIAFQMNRLNLEEDNSIPYTFFYRYEKDGMLTYLGKIKGAVTDLVVIPDFIRDSEFNITCKKSTKFIRVTEKDQP